MKKIITALIIAIIGLLTSCAVKLGPDGKPLLNIDRKAVEDASINAVNRGIDHVIRATK